MTANFSGDDTPSGTAEKSQPSTSGGEDAALLRGSIISKQRERFPVLVNVLEDYFVASDKSLTFLERYQKQGEARAEFEGLAEEIRTAIRNPQESAPLINAVLGSALSQQETRSMLSELLDQMLEQGDFSPDAIEAARAEERTTRQRPDPDVMFAYYARRKFALPFKGLKNHSFPLWAWFLGSAAVLAFGVVLGYIPWPEFLQWFPVTFIAAGVIGVAFSLVAMLGLRDEILNPDKEERREREKAEYQEKRENKRREKEPLSDRIRRTLS